ncbi:MAG: NAD(P)H-hydrate dehydratase [Candidatus Nanopelagicaceae bacterium]
MKPETWSAGKCAPYLSKPKPSDHKYRRGILGCVTGSKQYPGAALLTTSAALSVGIGMVRYFGPDSVKKAVLQNRPEVVIQTGNVDAYLLGSGIPAKKSLLRKITMEMANRADVPKVLDAGALYLAGTCKSPTIITPHSGELAELIKVPAKEIDADPIKYALEAARRFRVTVLLKGNKTVVANEHRVIQLPAAPSWLATAGTGDLLAGILGGLLALNHQITNHENLIEMGATASFLHAKAAEESSEGPLNLANVIDCISKVVSKLIK